MFKNFHDELREELKNTKEDLEKEVFKVIRIVDTMTEEVLYFLY